MCCTWLAENTKIAIWAPSHNFVGLYLRTQLRHVSTIGKKLVKQQYVLHMSAACSTFQTCILNSHQGHTMCGSKVDIQSAAAEIRRGIKKDRR